MLKKLA